VAGRCRRCSAELAPDARFCGSCGAASAQGRSEQRTRGALEHRELVRAGATLALGFTGVLVGCIAGAHAHAVQALAEAATLAACLAVLGGAGRMEAFSNPGPPRAWALAAAVAGSGLAVAWAYVRLLALLAGDAHGGLEPEPEGLGARLAWHVLAPGVLEELLCRGVLFTAAQRLASGRSAVVASAVLFAFLHGLNGAWLLELPHRFVIGVLLGWLRLRSGSVWPCVAAHLAHNAACVTLLGD
jgi:membrane protease YdiL (CAAX protease family)